MDEHPYRSNGRYRNRYSSDAHGPSMDLLKFFWEMRRNARLKADLPQVKPDVDWLKSNRNVDAITWIGHSSFLIQCGGLNILTDPHLTARASPLRHAGPKRLNPPALDFAALPKIDVVVVSHNHYDHLDRDTVKRLAQDHAPQFFVPLGLKAWFEREGIDKVMELGWWQHTQWDALRVIAVPVQHFSGRTASDRNATLWCGFVLELARRRLFFAGDTGYSKDFADIGERFAPMDLALIPIGAYEPRGFMRPVHVDPDEAVKIHQDIGSRQSVAMHWGTFRLTLEPMDDPPKRLAVALERESIAPEKFWVLKHGETRKF